MTVRVRVSRAGTVSAWLSASLVLLAAAAAHAQSPAASPAPSRPAPRVSQPKQVTGFVSSYEILRTVRAAGFDPLSPPLREGTVYVLRATDYRGIPMRVVLDARTGVIRDANRIIPGDSTKYGMARPQSGPSPYGLPAYGSPAYGPPPDSTPPYGPPDEGAERPSSGAAALPPMTYPPLPRSPATHPQMSARPIPPLPRPRPATIGLLHPQGRSQPEKTKEPGGKTTATSVQVGSGTDVNASRVDPGAASAHSPTPGKTESVAPHTD
ncbi:MAG: hypothetical protein WBF58_21715 [Xanthobacteraceae bacterium]